MMQKHSIEIPEKCLEEFCHHWQIVELAIFGSILRSDFNENSDIDFLVTYALNKKRESWGYFPEKEEMEQLLNRKVDWVTRKSVEEGRNPIFRREVLSTAEIIYAERK